jgi:hypothetical protein
MGASRLVERRFSRIDRPDEVGIVVDYQAWMDGGLVPARAVLRNERSGYRLTVETSSVERIAGP